MGAMQGTLNRKTFVSSRPLVDIVPNKKPDDIPASQEQFSTCDNGAYE